MKQAGLPPNMDKDLYVTVARSVKAALPDIHLHAFSPEEIIYGAKRNKISIVEMMTRLKDAGVNSFPGEKREDRSGNEQSSKN
jgi:2-iminoacetate synthase ThiH